MVTKLRIHVVTKRLDPHEFWVSTAENYRPLLSHGRTEAEAKSRVPENLIALFAAEGRTDTPEPVFVN